MTRGALKLTYVASGKTVSNARILPTDLKGTLLSHTESYAYPLQPQMVTGAKANQPYIGNAGSDMMTSLFWLSGDDKATTADEELTNCFRWAWRFNHEMIKMDLYTPRN